VVGDLGDQPGIDAVAAVGKHRVGGRHLHRRDRAGAQGHGQVGRLLGGVKAEARDPFLALLGADGLQQRMEIMFLDLFRPVRMVMGPS
jgi:hypothetical protein